jgi:hypothetical protein
MASAFANRGLAIAWRGAFKAGTVAALLCFGLFLTGPVPAHEGHDLVANPDTGPAAACREFPHRPSFTSLWASSTGCA